MKPTINHDIMSKIASILGDASNIEDGIVTKHKAKVAAIRIINRANEINDLMKHFPLVRYKND